MLDTYCPYVKIRVQQNKQERKIMTTINNKQAFELIESTRQQGSFFTVKFEKRTTGEIRTMNARLGVKRGVTGVGMAYKPSEKNLIACYDVEKAKEMKAQGMDDVTAAKKSYRMINLEGIIDLTVKGQSYTVEKL